MQSRADPAGPDAAEARLDLREALEALASPYALERFSVLTGARALVVDLDRGSAAGRAPGPEAAQAFARSLVQLACPAFALAREETPVRAALAPAFDVAVSSEDELAPLLAACARTPLAALALVQLLRQGRALDLHEALVAESLVYSTLQSGPEFEAWIAERSPGKPPPAEPGPAVRVERWGDQLVLSLNRPRRHNAFSVEIRDGLCEALQLAVADESVREIVLRGEGPSFSSGGDLSEFGDLPDPATAHGVRSTRNPGRLLLRCAARTTARVHGACIGAGIELPAFTHHVSAREDAFFQLPEVGMGLVPGAGGTASIPRRIGRQRTAWLALSGERIDAGRALAWGLVDTIER